MSPDQMPLFYLTGFIIALLVSILVSRRGTGPMIIGFAAASGLNIIVWYTYGMIMNWQPHWGMAQIIAGLLLHLPGFLFYSTLPAAGGFGLGFVIVKCFGKATNTQPGLTADLKPTISQPVTKQAQ